MTGPAPGDWPLSAAATAMLREPRTSAPALVALAVRELVAREVVVARLGPARRWQPQQVLLSPGRPPADLPRPLALVAEALLPQLEPGGTDATTAVRASLGKKMSLLSQVAEDTRGELVDRRLLSVERGRVLGLLPRTRVRRTPSGDAWAGSASAVTTGGAQPAVGLLLALDPAVRRAFAEEGDDVSPHLVLALDSALASAVDSGVGADGGGGGD